jgi:hypothetical protein
MVYLQHVIRVNSDSVPIVSRGICASCVLSGDAVHFGSLLCGQWLLRVRTEGDVHAILSAVQRFDICFSIKLLSTLIIAFRYIFVQNTITTRLILLVLKELN